MVCRSLHQGSVSKCGSQDTVRREMWLQKGHHVIHCSQCAQQDKVESEQWIAAKESPPWQPGHSIRSSCQENMLEIHPCSGRSVSSKIGPSQRAGIQSPIRADRSDRDLQGQSQAVGLDWICGHWHWSRSSDPSLTERKQASDSDSKARKNQSQMYAGTHHQLLTAQTLPKTDPAGRLYFSSGIY